MKILVIGPYTSIHIRNRLNFFLTTIHEIYFAYPFNGKVFVFKQGKINQANDIIPRYFKRYHYYKNLYSIFKFFFRRSLHQLFFGFLFYKQQLKLIVKHVKPDVTNGHIATSYAFWGALSGVNPFVLTVWGDDILIHPKRSIIYYFIVKYTLKKCNLIFADGMNMVSDLKKKVPNDRIKYIPLGVSIFHNKYKRNKQINRNSVNILSARALESLYQIDKIIKVFGMVRNNAAKLIIVNDGSLRKRLENLTKKLKFAGKIDFIGHVTQKELIDLYLQSDIYISLSKSDGTSVTLLEAMYYGLIPVVSDIEANRYWIKNRKNGFLVNIGKLKETIDVINYIVQNRAALKLKMISYNRKLIERKGNYNKNINLELEYLLNISRNVKN